MKKEHFIGGMMNTDWQQDAYGHFKITANGKIYRLKVQATSVRYEVKGSTSGIWFCKASDYFKNLEFGTTQAGRMSLALKGYRIPLSSLDNEIRRLKTMHDLTDTEARATFKLALDEWPD